MGNPQPSPPLTTSGDCISVILVTMKGLILASTSPRRQELLKGLGIDFQVVAPQVEERYGEGEDPAVGAMRIACRKARQVAEQFPGRLVLGADTIVVLDGMILGKPEDSGEAREMLKRLSGRVHRVITGFCLIDGERTVTRHVETLVKIKEVTDEELEEYLRTGEPLDKAGAYAIQGVGAHLVERIEGSYTNVVGLPLTELKVALRDIWGG